MSSTLPDDLVWDPEQAGHLSEIALTAIADGEEAILPANARAHLDACEACARKLGEAAMLSSAIGSMLRAAPVQAPARESSRARARMPRGAIAVGLALAALGALPMLLDLPAFASDAFFFLTRGLPIVLRSGISLARSSESASLTLTLVSAFVLVVVSLWIVRRVPPRPARVTEGAQS